MHTTQWKPYILSLFIVFLTLFNWVHVHAHTDHKTYQTYCPQTAELIKNQNHIWGTRTKWQSFSPSFSKQLTQFKGAQWRGQHIGKLLCIYSDNTSYTFPVSLAAPFLSHKPQGEHWKRNATDATLYNCLSSRIQDCPIMAIQEHENTLNSPEKVKDFLESIKNTPES